MKSKILRGLALDNQISLTIGDTTNIIKKAKEIHELDPLTSIAFGRFLSITSMMGNIQKGDKYKITTQIDGGGPIGKLLATVDSKGNIKGTLTNPVLDLNNLKPGIKIGDIVGKDGNITIIKDLGLKRPYVGKYSLTNGEISEDFTSYFYHSEQIPTSISAGVQLDEDFNIVSAGGFIIQLLPDADENLKFVLEERIKEMGSISELIGKGMSLEEILRSILGEVDINSMEIYDAQYICDCSKDRFKEGIKAIDLKELRDIIEVDKKAEIICQFCNEEYHFSNEELKQIESEKGGNVSG